MVVRDRNGREIGFKCSVCGKFSQGFAYSYYVCSMCNDQRLRDDENIKLRNEIKKLNNTLKTTIKNN